MNFFNPAPLPNPKILDTVSQPRNACTAKMFSSPRDILICSMSQIFGSDLAAVTDSEVKNILFLVESSAP